MKNYTVKLEYLESNVIVKSIDLPFMPMVGDIINIYSKTHDNWGYYKVSYRTYGYKNDVLDSIDIGILDEMKGCNAWLEN